MAVQLDEGHAIFLGPGEGESIPGPDRKLHVKAEQAEYEITEMDFGPEFGPVEPHVHSDHTDMFYVLEGEIEFTIGDETVRAVPGTFFAAPPGVRHGFRNPGPGRARVFNIHVPGTGFVERVRERNRKPED
jgi:mannose-6-phosphate isomerase-like protein (cupin superfamily)